jgi:hypothetical protein
MLDFLQVYPLGVCLFDIWLEVLWVLEIVHEVSEVEAFRLEAFVVCDVRDFRHAGRMAGLRASRWD